MIFNHTSRAKVAQAERLWVAKFVLRLLAITTVVIAFGLAGANWSNFGGRFYLTIWLAIPLSLSLAWNLANIIVRFSRARPMHPGANVGMDLVIWMAFIATLVFAWAAGIDGLDYSYICYYTYNGYCNTSSANDYENEIRQAAKINVAASVFGTIALVLHFILFIWACVDTSKRNQASVDTRAAAIASNIVSDMQARGLVGQPQQQAPSNVPNGNSGVQADHSYGITSENGYQYNSDKQSATPGPTSPTALHAAHMP